MAAKGFVPGLAGASAAGCAFVGSVANAAVKPIAAAARHPKAVKTAALGAAAAVVGADYLQAGDEFDGFDEDEDDEQEVVQP